jgi:hypothetical protein
LEGSSKDIAWELVREELCWSSLRTIKLSK